MRKTEPLARSLLWDPVDSRSPASRLICAVQFDDCLGAVTRRKFAINIVQMEMHGIGAYPKAVSNFLVKIALFPTRPGLDSRAWSAPGRGTLWRGFHCGQ